MGRQTKFQSEWLDLIDNNRNSVYTWCLPGKDEFHAFCRYCKKEFAIDNGGKSQLLQHSKTAKHKSNVKDATDTSQMKLKTIFTASGDRGVCLDRLDEASSQSNSKTLTSWNYSDEEKIIRAEILFVLHVAMNNYSFKSCDGIGDLFGKMFPSTLEAKAMQLSARKISYEISHGLGPYFLKQLSQVICASSFYTLMFDETLNEANKKQLDIHVRSWNEELNKIQQSYVHSEMLQHATAVNIDTALMNFINSTNLPLKKLIMLGSDGPNVNKAVFRIMDKRMQDMLGEGLVNIGTCNLHVVHNAFGEGLKIEAFQNIIEFLEDIDIWFRKYPSRQEDLQFSICNADMEESLSRTLRYVSNRWLSIVPACKRILSLYPGIKQHFLTDLVNKKSPLLKSERYKRLRKILSSNLTQAYLHFLVSVGSMFEKFLTFLQSNKTLVHVLYDEMSNLIIKLLFRFINMENYLNVKGDDLVSIPLKSIVQSENLKYLDVGCETSNLLSGVEPASKRCFKMDAQQFYLKTTTYLMEKLPLKNELLKCIQVFHPSVRKEALSTTTSIVKRLVKMLPRCLKSSEYDKVIDEWRLYTTDDEIIDDWCHQKDPNGQVFVKWNEIDFYWHKVMNLLDKNSQLPKYPYLTRIIKLVLCLSHGQAPVKRGFSINKRMMNERSSMSKATIISLRLIKDNVSPQVAETPISREMINYYREACSKYKVELEANRSSIKKKKIENNNVERSIKIDPKEKLNNLKGNVETAQKLIDEGSKRLELALKRKSFQDVSAAQALIAAGNKKLKTSQ